MTEPTAADIVKGLMKKLDHLELTDKEKDLLWAIVGVAKDHVQVADVPAELTFEKEFSTAFTPAAAEFSGLRRAQMIIKS